MPRVRTDAAAGEVFRDDVRGRVGAALPPGALADLTRLDDVQSLRALAITLSSTVIVVGSAAWVWSPWVVLPAIVLVATRQHALFVLAHEAAHHRLFARRGLNEFAGRAIGGVTGISMCAYRVVHRLHHNDLYGPSDPDMGTHGLEDLAVFLRPSGGDPARFRGRAAASARRHCAGSAARSPARSLGRGGLPDAHPAGVGAGRRPRCPAALRRALAAAHGHGAAGPVAPAGHRRARRTSQDGFAIAGGAHAHCQRPGKAVPVPAQRASPYRAPPVPGRSPVPPARAARPARRRGIARGGRGAALRRDLAAGLRAAVRGSPVAHYNRGLRGAAAVALRIQTFLWGRQ